MLRGKAALQCGKGPCSLSAVGSYPSLQARVARLVILAGFSPRLNASELKALESFRKKREF